MDLLNNVYIAAKNLQEAMVNDSLDTAFKATLYPVDIDHV